MKKCVSKLVTFILIVLTIFSCKSLERPSMHGGRKQKVVEVIIANHRVNCTGLAPQMCYLIKLKEEDEWRNYYNELEGFEYEEGYEYRLKVKMESLGNSYKDVSDYKYYLVEVISKIEKPIVISPLYDTWGLLELNGKVVDIGKMTRSPLMDINTLKKRIQASTGCNSFSTSIEFNDETKLFTVKFPFAISEMACPNSIEAEYLKALEKVNSYDLKGIDLFLKMDNEVLFHLRKVD
jgi:heat shock protein HslJ